jgi:phenylacetate-CoA ligase
MGTFQFIFNIGSRLRNPSLKEKLLFLKDSQSWDLDQLISFQIKRLNDLLVFSNQYSNFYRSHFQKNGINLKIKYLEDLKQIPPITKNELIMHNDDIHTKYKFKKTFFSETSGSTGQVLTFNKNEEWDSENRAAMYRAYNWYNVKPWEYNIYMWGYNIDKKKQKKIRVMDFIQNRYRIFDYNTDSLRLLVDKISNTSYIHGYSSMIYELAKIINAQKIKTFSKTLKMIKGTSEKIFSHYNQEIEKAFGIKMISEYGAAEAGLISFECRFGNMHINMENVIVEEENDEIIVTNLASLSFPIIRYKLGDYVKLLPSQKYCECGLKHPIIDEVRGRVGKNIYGLHKIYPSLTFYYIFKNLYFEKGIKLSYQCIQKEKGYLLVLIKEKYSENLEMLIKSEFEKYFKEDVQLRIKFSQVLRTYKNKLIDFISEINNS